MKPIISAKNLNFIYNQGKDNEFHALINVNLDIYPEEYIIIFGPSGCGKSTLLNVIAGLEVPTDGSLYVFDRDLTKITKREFAEYHRREVGMIFQSYNLITSLTVLENVALPQLFVNVGKRKREKWSMQMLERFGILKHAKKIPTELSGGQQQRIGIARAIVNNPQIILADEPVGNLDSASAKNVLEILDELNKNEKKTIILVTHNPEYLDHADRIIYMKDGIITREVVNTEKGKKKRKIVKSAVTQINELMRAYHGLDPEQINILIMPYKSKIFAHHFISTRNMEETRVMEDVIQRRLLGTISQEELFDILNRPSDEGGVGFDKRTAAKIIRRINRIIRIAYFTYQKTRQRKDEHGEHIKVSYDEKAERLTAYLLNTCYFEHKDHLSSEQRKRLTGAIKERLMNSIQKSGFYHFLDMPVKEGGVGLNSKTAKAITEELELILILGYGVIHNPALKKEKTPVAVSLSTGGLVSKGALTEGNKKIKESINEVIKDIPLKEMFVDKTPTETGKQTTSADKSNKDVFAKKTVDVKKEFDKNKSAISPQISLEEQKESLIPKTPTLQDAIFAAQEKEEKIKKSSKK